ncbi:hypothetical protein CHUAL_009624 [Chamberlinius hualienensis]
MVCGTSMIFLSIGGDSKRILVIFWVQRHFSSPHQIHSIASTCQPHLQKEVLSAFMVNGLQAELGKAVAPCYNLPFMELRKKIIQIEETHSRYNKGASSIGNLLKPTPDVSTVVPAKHNPPIAASISTSTTIQCTPFKCFICGSEQHRARECSFYGKSKAYMFIEDDEEALPIEDENSSNSTETIQLISKSKKKESKNIRKCHPPMVLMYLGTITEDALLDTADKYLAIIPFQISPHYFRANFWLIPGIKQITLLGRDFISKYGLLIDCQQHQWSHKGRDYPFLSTEEPSNTIHNMNESEAQRWAHHYFQLQNMFV